MCLCLRHHGTMSPEYLGLQVLLINVILNVYTIQNCDCASISTGHWNHGTTKKPPKSQVSTPRVFTNTPSLPTSKLQDYSTRYHPSSLKYYQTSHGHDDTGTTRWSRSHRTIQDHLDPIGLVDVISKDLPAPRVAHSRVTNIAAHDNVGLTSPHSIDQAIIKQQVHQDITSPGNLWTTAVKKNVQGTTVNKMIPNLIESQTYDETKFNTSSVESDKTSDSSLHNEIKTTESSQDGLPMDKEPTSPMSNSEKKDAASLNSFVNSINEHINPLDTTLEEHLFYSSMNLSPDDIFTLCNLLPPALHPFPYDTFPQHLSAFSDYNGNSDQTEEIILYAEEPQPSSNHMISNDRTKIENNKDSLLEYTKLETVSNSHENTLTNNYTIYPLNGDKNNTTFINHVNYSDAQIDYGDYYQESEDSFSDQHLLEHLYPLYELMEHYSSLDILETDNNNDDFNISEIFSYSDLASTSSYKDSLISVHNNNFNKNNANPSKDQTQTINQFKEFVSLSKVPYTNNTNDFLTYNFSINSNNEDYMNDMTKTNMANHTEIGLPKYNHELNFKGQEDVVNQRKDSIKSLKHTDRQEQIVDILSQLNLLLENEDSISFNNTGYNCRKDFYNSNEDIVQQENGDEVIDHRVFGGLRKVSKGVDIVKQMGECVMSKASYALQKLNMFADQLKGQDEDELSRFED